MTEPMPTLEVGDWVSIDGRLRAVTKITHSGHRVHLDSSFYFESGKAIRRASEIRKADGRVWRRETETR